MKPNFEIYTDEECAYGGVREIRLSDSEPDGRWVFATFTQAKQELLKTLRAEEDELREQLALVRYNRQDLRRLTRKQLSGS